MYSIPGGGCGREMCEADDNSYVKMGKNIQFRQLFLSIRGEFLYNNCIYEWWLISRGGGCPPPPHNESLITDHLPPLLCTDGDRGDVNSTILHSLHCWRRGDRRCDESHVSARRCDTVGRFLIVSIY